MRPPSLPRGARTAQRAAGTLAGVNATDLRDLVRFSDDGPVHAPVHESERLWSELVCLDRNQGIGPIADPDSDAICLVVTGKIVVQLVPWAVGFALFHWSVPTGPQGWIDAVRTVVHGWLHLPFPLFDSALGASLPSFAVAFALSLLVLPRRRISQV